MVQEADGFLNMSDNTQQYLIPIEKGQKNQKPKQETYKEPEKESESGDDQKDLIDRKLAQDNTPKEGVPDEESEEEPPLKKGLSRLIGRGSRK